MFLLSIRSIIASYYIAFFYSVHQCLFDDLPFGYIPFSLSFVFVSTIHLSKSLFNNLDASLQKFKLSRYRNKIEWAVLIVLPALFFISGKGTDHFVLVSNELLVSNFLLQIGFGVILLYPLVHQTLKLFKDATNYSLPKTIHSYVIPFILASSAIGLFFGQWSASAIPLHVNYVILIGLTALSLIYFSNAQETLHETSDHDPKEKSQKKERPKALNITGAFIIAFTLLLPFMLVVWFVRWNAQLDCIYGVPQFNEVMKTIIGIVGIAGGYVFSIRVKKKVHPDNIFLSNLFFLLTTLILTQILWAKYFFKNFFLAFQSSQLAQVDSILATIIVFGLPTMSVGIFLDILTTRTSKDMQSASTLVRLVYLSIGAGLFLSAFVFVSVSDSRLFMGIIIVLTSLSILSVVSSHISTRSRVVLTLIFVIIGIWGATSTLENKQSIIDTAKFDVLHNIRMAVGRFTLIQSRNYDDPLFAIMYDETQALTQTSTSVQPLLTRLGLLPFLLHQKPELILSFGVGSTFPLNTLAHNPNTKIDVVEESPALIELADTLAVHIDDSYRKHFVHFYCQPWLSFIQSRSHRYDLIISAEPFARVANRHAHFSPEFFGAIQDHLAPDGLFAQWLPLNKLNPEEFKSICRAMRESFSHVELWIGDSNPQQAVICIVGANRPLTYSHDRFDRLLASKEIKRDILRAGFTTWQNFLSYFLLSDGAIDPFIEHGNSYSQFDHTKFSEVETNQSQKNSMNFFYEFFRRRSLSESLLQAVPDSLRSSFTDLFNDEEKIFRAQVAITAGQNDSARSILLNIIRSNPKNTHANYVLGELLVYEGAVKVSRQELEGARMLLEEAVKLGRVTPYVCRLLMIVSYKLNDLASANVYINQGARLDKRNAGLFDNAATLFANDGKIDEAVKNYNRALAINPRDVDIYCNYAATLFNRNSTWDAIRILDRAIANSTNPTRAYYMQGLMYNDRGKYREALASYTRFMKRALPNDPRVEEVQKAITQLKKIVR